MSEERLPDLYLEAVELDEAGRRELLAALRPGDPNLADELERLLAAAEGAASPLDHSPLVAAGIRPAPLAIPQQVGPYRLVCELGRGGMGRVFLAEQHTPDFRRVVALKLIDRPGPDEDAVRRFRDEVRILASLDHPGIVRFIDGGQSPEGIWFLAQEYVEGEDLIAHARQDGLSVTERVALFRSVLETVEAAHARGVVHRDLKPSNLLVGPDGRPRLLDFGISKLVDPDGAAGGTEARHLSTRSETLALTPAYASPEQLAGRAATVASDIYSLGVLLYELLAGERPFAAMGDSRVEQERAILEREPEPPSAAARRRAGEAAAMPARGRGGTRRGRGELTGDLDAICLKALRKEPGERYAGAAAFADDLRRYLDGQPVAARRGGRRYRLSRFARRHRAGIAAATASALAVVAVLVAVAAVRRGGQPDSARPPQEPPPQTFPFSDVGATPIEELERRFFAAPDSVEAGASLALALTRGGRSPEAALVVARMRQIPGREQDPLTDYVDASVAMDVGQPQRALVLFTRARDRAVATGRGELVAQVRASRGRLLSTLGKRDEARSEMELARADFERIDDHASLARVLNDLAIERLELGELDRGEELLELAAAETRAAGRRPVVILANLGLLKIDRGRPDLAEPMLREALELQRQAPNPGRDGVLTKFLAAATRDLGRPGEATALLEQGIGLLRQAERQTELADALYLRGLADLEGARLGTVPVTVAEMETVAGLAGDKLSLGLTSFLRGRAAAAAGDLPAARRELAEARRLLVDSGHVDLGSEVDLAAAAIEHAAGDSRAALRLLDAAVGRLAGGGAGGRIGFLATTLRAQIEAESGRLVVARRLLGQLGELNANAPSLERRAAWLEARATVRAAEGRFEEARNDQRSALHAASAGDRGAEVLRLRLGRAAIEARAGNREHAARTAASVATEAESLGLVALAARARRLAGSPAGR
jgi:serine/threonine-protein kinase